MLSTLFYMLLLSYGTNCQLDSNTGTVEQTTATAKSNIDIDVTSTTLPTTATTDTQSSTLKTTSSPVTIYQTNATESITSTNTSTTSAITTATATTTPTPLTTTTTATTTPTTTMKPCKKMRFVNRLSQDNPEVTIFAGTTFTLDCSVSHDDGPEPTITWLKEDKPLQETSYRTYPKEKLQKAFKLVLSDVTLVDAGKYKCSADNVCSKAISTTFKLIVIAKPKSPPTIASLLPADLEVFVGEDVTFTCTSNLVKGNPTPFIRWVKHRTVNITVEPTESITNKTLNATVVATTTTAVPTTRSTDVTYSLNIPSIGVTSYLENGQINEITDLKMEQAQVSTLTITKATENNTATYQCLVINEKGIARQATVLTVKPIPPLSKEELEKRYIEEYGEPPSKMINLLPVLFALPVFVIILLVVGCVWWHENESRKKENLLKANRVQPASEAVVAKENPPKSRIIIPDVIISDPHNDYHSMCYPSSSEISIDYSRPSTSHSQNKIPNETDVNCDSAHLLSHDHQDEPEPSRRGENNNKNNRPLSLDEWEHIDDDAH